MTRIANFGEQEFAAHQQRVKGGPLPRVAVLDILTDKPRKYRNVPTEVDAPKAKGNWITLNLPFPPSANAYMRHSMGMHFPSVQAKRFARNVANIVTKAEITPLAGRLTVQMTLLAPTAAKRDIDNYAKPTIDALMHAGCFTDDEQIDELHITRGPIFKGGQVRVTIREV